VRALEVVLVVEHGLQFRRFLLEDAVVVGQRQAFADQHRAATRLVLGQRLEGEGAARIGVDAFVGLGRIAVVAREAVQGLVRATQLAVLFDQHALLLAVVLGHAHVGHHGLGLGLVDGLLELREVALGGAFGQRLAGQLGDPCLGHVQALVARLLRFRQRTPALARAQAELAHAHAIVDRRDHGVDRQLAQLLADEARVLDHDGAIGGLQHDLVAAPGEFGRHRDPRRRVELPAQLARTDALSIGLAHRASRGRRDRLGRGRTGTREQGRGQQYLQVPRDHGVGLRRPAAPACAAGSTTSTESTVASGHATGWRRARAAACGRLRRVVAEPC